MANYLVTYLGDSTSEPNTYYKVRYERLNEEGEVAETFVLKPFAQINPDMGGLIASPDTRHYANQDIYTHVTSVPKKDAAQDEKSYTRLGDYKLRVGDTLQAEGYVVRIAGVDGDPSSDRIPFEEYDIAAGLKLEITDGQQRYEAKPLFVVKNGQVHRFPDEAARAGLQFHFENILPGEDRLELAVWKRDQEVPDYIIMKAIVFPWINLLWAGSVLMVVGFVISVYQRTQEHRRAARREQASPAQAQTRQKEALASH
jgi:cytochrome c-type biogenesis protein CcmF